MLVVAATVVAGVVTLLGLASTVAGRRIGLLHLAGAGVLEALLVVQAVVAGIAMAGGDAPADTPTFLSYLFGVLLIPVAGVLWARSEPTRWAGTILAVASAAAGVMVWRLLQLWEATGA
ncbi:conserved membrane protein of unknown function [Blastococcus saxobsidens DD2]|uniref:Integral membrane protein n=1 Tax=Blastococcus saxobsidens (strain DD2) TaxID=1146883 RepID=H6RV42_BLASD|nr:conserved membrane protein of unknown function [Blastococcus saxobsidens DD2]